MRKISNLINPYNPFAKLFLLLKDLKSQVQSIQSYIQSYHQKEIHLMSELSTALSSLKAAQVANNQVTLQVLNVVTTFSPRLQAAIDELKTRGFTPEDLADIQTVKDQIEQEQQAMADALAAMPSDNSEGSGNPSNPTGDSDNPPVEPVEVI